MAVGDVNSDKRGSGARFNDGKLQMDLIPVSYWIDIWYERDLLDPDSALATALDSLSSYQLGDELGVSEYMRSLDFCAMSEATRVLEYGAQKYAAWNWAKGMNWSVPTGCILRHAAYMLEEDQYIDLESGRPHMGHIDCNMLMLAWFQDQYPEGDDRPPVLLSIPTNAELAEMAMDMIKLIDEE